MKENFPLLGDAERTTILALSWRDVKAPKTGGAETHTHEILRRLDQSRFRIIHFSPLFPGAKKSEVIDGVQYYRQGNLATVIIAARKFYKQNANRIDFVIDQCNSHRFFTSFWVPASKRIFFIHQLTREIWGIQARFPLSFVGRITEGPLLRLNKNDTTIALSESTRQDLIAVGFKPDKIHLVYPGMESEPWQPSAFLPKQADPTFIYVGRFARYKGIDASIDALALVKKKYPNARLWVVGKKDEAYIQDVLAPKCQALNLSFGDTEQTDITFWGFVKEEKKLELQSRSQALLFPSMREGWGIIVIEAAAVGTPSIVYNSPGCRDAVDNGKAGYLCEENTPEDLATLMLKSIDDPAEYQQKRDAAYQFSTSFTWDRSSEDFNKIIGSLQGEKYG